MSARLFLAQVLASKQAAALRAREAAGNATKRLRRFMAELDTQVGQEGRRTPCFFVFVGGSGRQVGGRLGRGQGLVGAWVVRQRPGRGPRAEAGG